MVTVEQKKVNKKKEYQKNKEYYRQKGKEYRANNPDYKKKMREWRKNHPNKSLLYRKGNLSKFGLSLEDFDKIYKSQNGCCKICKIPEADLTSPSKLCVDHDHKTGKVRGLLCPICNHGLGNFRDNIEIIKEAIKYLQDGDCWNTNEGTI